MIINLWKIQHYFYNRKKNYQIKVITVQKNYDESVETNNNQNWPYIPDYPYRILIIGGSRSGKTNFEINIKSATRY